MKLFSKISRFYLGLVKDDQTLSGAGLTNGSKMMLVGSKLNDVISVTSKVTEEVTTSKNNTTKQEPLSKQKPHTKVNYGRFLLNYKSTYWLLIVFSVYFAHHMTVETVN